MHKNLPLITIGMPVYNGDGLIEKALDSLLSQTYSNFELIISDNCSSDSTFIICEQAMIKDSRIRLIRQNENIGPLANFEYVLNMAKGKYFMWAAHDDIWDVNWLAKAVSGFEEDVVMVTSDIIGVDDDGKEISSPVRFEFKGSQINRLSRFFLIPEWHGKANIIYSLIRTDIAQKYQFPKADGFYGFDMHFIFFLLTQGACKFIKGKALYKRVPKVNYKPYTLTRFDSLLMLLKRNLTYIFTYIYIAESLLAKVTILLLLPLKLITLGWYVIKSVLRRYSIKRV